jgi:hypothetical protein
MNRLVRRAVFITIALSVFWLAMGSVKADKIGIASVVVNQVESISGRDSRALSVGSDVFLRERIRTLDASTAQLLFLDKTSLTIGPNAELRLDRFVYNPDQGGGRVVINAAQGAFRFITGSQNPTSYTINTPVASVGIRGTILDLLVTGTPTTGFTLTVVLDECCAFVTLATGQKLNLTKPGTAYVLTSAGAVTGPIPWDGTIVSAGNGLTFPLFGWYFNGEPPPNGFASSQLGNIDQLNAIIAQQLNTMKPCVRATNRAC